MSENVIGKGTLVIGTKEDKKSLDKTTTDIAKAVVKDTERKTKREAKKKSFISKEDSKGAMQQLGVDNLLKMAFNPLTFAVSALVGTFTALNIVSEKIHKQQQKSFEDFTNTSDTLQTFTDSLNLGKEGVKETALDVFSLQKTLEQYGVSQEDFFTALEKFKITLGKGGDIMGYDVSEFKEGKITDAFLDMLKASRQLGATEGSALLREVFGRGSNKLIEAVTVSPEKLVSERQGFKALAQKESKGDFNRLIGKGAAVEEETTKELIKRAATHQIQQFQTVDPKTAQERKFREQEKTFEWEKAMLSGQNSQLAAFKDMKDIMSIFLARSVQSTGGDMSKRGGIVK